MPVESSQHSCTLMAFPSIESTDSEDDLKLLQNEIATIANTISKFEPVHLFARSQLIDQAKALTDSNVFVKEGCADQLWIRDTGPVYVQDTVDNKVTAVNFNFNYWGAKLPNTGDEALALSIAEQANEPLVTSSIVLEGGAIEHDGEGTFLGTESCIINDKRNSGKSKSDLEAELAAILGVSHFVWLPGIVGEDITDDHIDAVARFIKPGVVLLRKPHPSAPHSMQRSYKENIAILSKARDARGRTLTIHEVDECNIELFGPADEANGVVASYTNYYLVNGGVVMPEFGQKTDEKALALLEDLFPEREVVQVPLNMLPRTGGGIHCATQQVPA